MHEATQRRLLRGAFLLLCVLPTLAVIGWAILWSLPGHTAALERDLRRQLGVRVHVSRLTHVRPGWLQLDGVQFVDPETRELLLEVATLQTRRTEGNLQLCGSRAVLAGDQWRRLWRLLQDRVLAQDLPDGQSIHITCDQVTIASAEGTCLLQQVEGTLRPDPTALSVTVRLGALNAPNGSSARIAVRRVREGDSPHTELLVDAQTRSLPLQNLPLLPQRLGRDARFCGQLTIVAADSGTWNCDVTGRLEDVDVKTALLADSPYHLAIAADVELRQAQFGVEGLRRAAGRCRADSGTIAPALLRSLVSHHFGVAGPALAAWTAESDAIPIRQMAIDWQIDERGLALQGCLTAEQAAAEKTPQQVALRGDDGPLWTGPWHPAVHVEYLVRAFVPPDLKDAPVVARRLQQRLPRSAPTLDRAGSERTMRRGEE